MIKKLILIITVFAINISLTSAQVLPTFQFGIKGGLNLTGIQYSVSTFNSSNQAGYLAGFWARFGALGFNFQPELYLTSKNTKISNANGGETNAKFTSVDMPLLFGAKVGAAGFGGRFYTGPVISFAIDKNQSFSGAVDKAFSLNYKNQNFAWQFGGGLDVKRISIDLRYEAGITKQTYGYAQTHVNLFNLSLAYRLFKL
jgi:hypothetical protein